MNSCIVPAYGLLVYHLTGSFVFTLCTNFMGGDLRFLFCLLMATPLLLSGAIVTKTHFERRFRTHPLSGFTTLLLTLPASTLFTVLLYSPIYLRMDIRWGCTFAGSLAVSAIVAGLMHFCYIEVVRVEAVDNERLGSDVD